MHSRSHTGSTIETRIATPVRSVRAGVRCVCAPVAALPADDELHPKPAVLLVEHHAPHEQGDHLQGSFLPTISRTQNSIWSRSSTGVPFSSSASSASTAARSATSSSNLAATASVAPVLAARSTMRTCSHTGQRNRSSHRGTYPSHQARATAQSPVSSFANMRRPHVQKIERFLATKPRSGTI